MGVCRDVDRVIGAGHFDTASGWMRLGGHVEGVREVGGPWLKREARKESPARWSGGDAAKSGGSISAF